MTERSDFHVHYLPAEVESAYEAIDIASSQQVTAISLLARSEISPHFHSFKEYGKQRGVKVFTGMEVVTNHEGDQMDLVAIGFDHEHPAVSHWRSDRDRTQEQKETAKKHLIFLLRKGLSFFDEEEKLNPLLDGEGKNGSFDFCLLADSSQNQARLEELKHELPDVWADVQMRYGGKPEYQPILNAKFLYLAFFAFGREGNVSKIPDTQEVIRRIHDAGGVVLYSPEGDFSQARWQTLKTLEIDGIMAWHGSQMELSRHELKDAGLVLGGSDYQKKDWKLGDGDGKMYISKRRTQKLEAVLKAKEVVYVQ